MSDPFSTMRINAPKGQTVVFTGRLDNPWGGGHANDQLKEGAVYTVEKTKVFGSHSLVILEEYPGEDFNTVMFEETGEIFAPTHTAEELYRMGVTERWARVM